MSILKKLAIFVTALIFTVGIAYAGLMDRMSDVGLHDTGNYIYGPEISAGPGAPTGSNWRIYVVSDVPYFISDGQAAISMIDSGTTAWDDIDDPDANSTIDFGAYYSVQTCADLDKNMFQFEGTGAYGDYAIVSITQKTGDPTNGQCLYITTADDDVDAVQIYNSTADLDNANVLLTLDYKDDDDSDGSYIVCRDDEQADTVFKVGPGGDLTVSESLLIDEDSVTFTGAGGIVAGASSALTLDAGGGNAAGEDLIVTAHNVALTATGALSFTPDATVTTAITVTDDDYTNALSVGTNAILGTTGIINYTNFDVAADGDVVCVDLDASGNVTVTGTLDVTGAVTMGAITQDALTATGTATTLTLDGSTTGGVTVGGISTGTVTLGASGAAAATLVNLPATVDMTISGGDFAVTDTANADMVTFTNNTVTAHDILTMSATGTRTSGNVIKITDGATTGDTITITANTQTSGCGISYTNTGQDLSGAAINLSITDNANFDGDYIRCYDGSAEDFTIERYGEVTVGGLAGSDMLTITAGDVQITDGYVDIDDGYIAVDSDEDHASNITRNFDGAGTNPVLTVSDTHASSTNVALRVNQDGTGLSTCLKLEHSGDNPVIDIDAGAARTGDIIDILMTNQLAEKALAISGAITGTAGEGVIEIHGTGNIASTASLLRIDADTGTPAGTAGYCIMVDDDSLTKGSAYAVEINSNANGALNVSKGVSIFADVATFTNGVDIDEDIDIDFDDAAEEISVVQSVESDNDLAMLTLSNTDSDLTDGNLTANAYMLRMRYADEGDADAAFVVCEDNNGDDVFLIDYDGSTTADGKATFTAGVAPGSSTSTLMTDTVNLTAQEVRALKATPHELVAAPGAANFIEVVSVKLILDDGTDVFTEADDNLTVQYDTSGDDIITDMEMTGFIDQNADMIMTYYPTSPQAANASADLLNDGVELYNPDDEIGGQAQNDSQLTVIITYWIHAAGL